MGLMQLALDRLEREIDAVLLHEHLDDSIRMAATLAAKRAQGEYRKELTEGFQACVRKAVRSFKALKQRGISQLFWPDGTNLDFTERKRHTNALPRSVLQRIRADNWMDTLLHEHARRLFNEHLKRLESEGVLAELERSTVAKI
eukprot:NODE_4626_length_655_cov_322.551667.p2 GENE.NODE_4626_length_655_cov_322.551667~~NODE_4626_length_655_cov_322.551667.p2  ORF type:complete len:144 (+),score=51.92 NODE_4626_length_655_cov_322.551667:3-434(+)